MANTLTKKYGTNGVLVTHPSGKKTLTKKAAVGWRLLWLDKKILALLRERAALAADVEAVDKATSPVSVSGAVIGP